MRYSDTCVLFDDDVKASQAVMMTRNEHFMPQRIKTVNDAVTVARPGPGSTFIRRAVFGVVAFAMALASVMTAWAPKAEAQPTDPIQAIVGGALTPETMKAICGDVGSDGGALACVGKLASAGLDFAECVTPKDKNADGARKKEISDCAKELFESFQNKEKEKKKSDEEEGPPDLSLYRVSSALTSMYVNSLVPGGLDQIGSGGSDKGDSDKGDSGKPDSEGGNTGEGDKQGDNKDTGDDSSDTTNVTQEWSAILNKPSSAGGAVSRPDERSAENSKWLLGVGDGSNDARFSYDSFARSSNDAPDAGVSLYNDYGAVLNGLGFDSTIDKESSGGDLVGQAGSSLMLLAYMGSGAIDTLFDGVVEVLQSINPFYWLYKGVSHNTNETFTEGMKGTEQNNSAFGDLQDFLADLYDGVAAIGWYVTIPLFIGLTVAGMLFMRRFDKGKHTKNLVLRVAFLVVGVPLLGVTYTGALENLKGASGDSAGANSSKIVLSTYVDFDNWANKARLSPPNGSLIEWNRTAHAPTEESQASVRQTALAINAQAQADEDLNHVLTVGVGGSSDSDASFFSDVLTEDGDFSNSGSLYASVVDMLSRSIKKETVSSADYESGVKGALSALSSDPSMSEEGQKKIASWVQDYSSADELSNMKADEIEKDHNPLIDVTSGMEAGHSQRPGGGDDTTRFMGYGNTKNCTSSAVVSGWQPGWGTPAPDVAADDYDGRTDCNLSPLAMYNYLNTSFGSNGATVYSPNSSVSAYSRNQHASVSMVGSGMMQTVYWMSSMTLLVSFILIGLFYALSMMFGTIKRGLQLIGSIPFATMGFMAAIAKTVVYTAAMFLEIFGTLVMYKIVQEFLMIVPSLLEKPIANGEGGQGFGSTVIGQMPMASDHPMISVLIMTVIGTVGTLVFVVMAIKMRGSLISAFDEAMTRLVNKFTDSQVSSASEPSGGALRQGLVRGAGMAATHAVLSGGNDVGDADGADGGDVDGPGGSGNGAAAAAGGAAGAGGLMAASDAQAGADEPGIESMDVDADSGNGMESSETINAKNQGVPAGDYDVDAQGNLVDGSGNPITDANGNSVGVDEITATDANGNLVDSSGQPLTDANGQPIPASAVGGMNSDGYLTDANGGELVDGNGRSIAADGVAGANQMATVGAGDQESSFAGDRSMADQVVGQGGLSDSAAETMPYSGETTGDASGLAGQSPQSQPSASAGGTVGGSTAAAAAGAVGGAAAASGLAGMASASAPKVLNDAASRATGGSAATDGVGQAAMNNISSAGHQAANEVRTIRENIGGGASAGQVPQTPMSGYASNLPQAPTMPNIPSGPNITRSASSQGPSMMGMLGAGVAGAAATRGAQSVIGPHRSRDMSENTGGRGGASGARGARGESGKSGRRGASSRRGRNTNTGMGMRTAMMLGNQGLGGDGTGVDGHNQHQGSQNPGSSRGPGDSGSPMQGGPRPGGGGRNG